MCSPPLRQDRSEQDGLWQGVINGTFTTLASDHAPIKFAHPNGKQFGLAHGSQPHGRFKFIPNGLPGVETRLPLLFGDVVSGRITPQRFVQLTSTGPAQLYGLGKKGTIAPGYDADLTIWHPQSSFVPFCLTNEMLHHSVDYTPYEGFEFKNWPRYTVLRGQVVYQEGKVVAKAGVGHFQRRTKNLLPGPRGHVWTDI